MVVLVQVIIIRAGALTPPVEKTLERNSYRISLLIFSVISQAVTSYHAQGVRVYGVNKLGVILLVTRNSLNFASNE